jgi:hypothetical protein
MKRANVRRHAIAVLLALPACTTLRPPAPTSPNLVVFRHPSYLDSTGVARRTGTVHVAVRSVERPIEPLVQGMVTILDAARRQLRRGFTNPQGIAAFDTLPAASYTLRVAAIGYGPFELTIPVTPGCATDVEVYLTLQFIGIDPVIVVDPRASRAPVPRLETERSITVSAARSTTTICTGA